MTIEEFATRHRVRPRRDTCNEEIIPGRPHKAARQEDRSHVYDHGDGQHFGLALMLDNSRKWTFAKQRLARLGFVVKQDGEGEGTLLFDPTEEAQAALYRSLRRVHAKDLADVKSGKLPKRTIRLCKQAAAKERRRWKTTRYSRSGS